MNAEEWIQHTLTELGPWGAFLDVCCGDGKLVNRVAADFGMPAFGVDRDATALRWARSSRPPMAFGGRQPQFAAMDAEALGLKGESFSWVACVHSLHHTAHPDVALAEMRRILKPEGHLLLVDWQEGAQTGVPERYFPESEIRDLVENAGFTIETFRTMDQQYFILGTAQLAAPATEDEKLKRAVYEKLKTVIDPETGMDVITMDMILDLRVKDGNVSFKFRPSSPFCPIAVSLSILIKRAVQEVEGVKHVDMVVVDFVDAENLNRELQAL